MSRLALLVVALGVPAGATWSCIARPNEGCALGIMGAATSTASNGSWVCETAIQKLFEGIGGCKSCSCIREESDRRLVAVRTTDCDAVAAQITQRLGGRGVVQCSPTVGSTEAGYLLLGPGAHLTMIEKLASGRHAVLLQLATPDRKQLAPVPPSWIDRARLLRRQVPPPTTSSTCQDTSHGATDADRYGCSAYNAHGDECGRFDTVSFTANSMCCGCGGGHFDFADTCTDLGNGRTDADGQPCPVYRQFPQECGNHDSATFNASELCCACGGGYHRYVENCTDGSEGRIDSSGYTCRHYTLYPAECGHHDSATFSANTMCCACGGGGELDCTDTSQGARDDDGDGCDEYASDPNWCGRFDTATFSSNSMCCGCGGGSKGRCADAPGEDSDGVNCAWYANNHTQYCGRYDSPTFSAATKCCACGGGVDQGCGDTDGTAQDAQHKACSSYNFQPSKCGKHDDADFTADDMCCGCGGGDVLTECADTANGTTDQDGYGCAQYEQFPGNCGRHDTDTFHADELCCTCGGGSASLPTCTGNDLHGCFGTVAAVCCNLRVHHCVCASFGTRDMIFNICDSIKHGGIDCTTCKEAAACQH